MPTTTSVIKLQLSGFCLSTKDNAAYSNKEMRSRWMKLDALHFTFQFTEWLLSTSKWHYSFCSTLYNTY